MMEELNGLKKMVKIKDLDVKIIIGGILVSYFFLLVFLVMHSFNIPGENYAILISFAFFLVWSITTIISSTKISREDKKNAKKK